MTDVHPECPLLSPITILSYVSESDVVYAPDHKHIESRHRRIWQYFITGDVFKARSKACHSAQKEINRFAEHHDDSTDDHSPYQGIKLYFEYRLNWGRRGKKDNVYRFYLLNREAITRIEQLERMEQESLFLIDAGNIFRRVEVEDDEGRLFMVVADGMVCL